MKKKEAIKEKQMSLKASESIHTKVKLYCVKNKLNLLEFVDSALLLKLKTESK